MDVQQIEGPRLGSASGKTRQLVIILHGYGADGADLISLAQQWQHVLPDAEFVAPNAHQSCPNSPMGYQWFPLNVTMQGVVSTPEERLRGALDAAPVINAFIDAELARTGLKTSDLALVGFSQGAMMALHVGLRRPKAPAAIVSFSGMLLETGETGDMFVKPPVFLAHGSHDEVVPFGAMEQARRSLGAKSIEVSTHVEQGVGHGIDMEAMSLAGAFLAKNLT